MSQPEKSTRPQVTPADWIVRTIVFLLLATAMFSPPMSPANELDSSWRMVLSKAFHEGWQFGTDVVFTYGPLGYLMGRTYCGIHFTSLIAWQVVQALVFTLIVFRQGLRLEGYARYAYFGFFLLMGAAYEDALHQMAIALAGLELIRRDDERLRVLPAAFAAMFGALGLIKFTDLLLGGAFVCAAAALHLWHRRRADAIWVAAWFLGSFLVGWMLCGQNPLNLPDYFFNSWEISQGYQETMGVPTPPDAFVAALASLAFLAAYLTLNVLGATDRPRALALVGGTAAFIFLNWKHGFVRSDGHMIGYFYCTFVPATAFPALLADTPRFRRAKTLLLLGAFAAGIVGVGVALPGVIRWILGNGQERIVNNVRKLADLRGTYAVVENDLRNERSAYLLPETRKIVRQSPIDVIGYEQAVAIYNDFNYRPRPVFQSYSAYRPWLSHLNFKYYASDRAPEFVLLKLHTIDRRLVTMDDAQVLSLLLHRYEYVLTEKGYHLWRRKPGPFNRGDIAPRQIYSATLALGQPLLTAEFADRHLWATVKVQPSLVGRLRAFLYKLPIVTLKLKNNGNATSEYRLPPPQGRTGFILNPIVEDITSYMNFAGGKPERFVHALTVDIPPADKWLFRDEYTVTLSELPASNAGREYFHQAEKRLFRMFDIVPTSYSAQTPISDGKIDGRSVMVLHAPSEMTFDVPKGASALTGAFGFLEAAYTGDNRTDGARFTISFVSAADETVLLERTLDPLNKLNDRGLQSFRLALPPNQAGYLRLRVHPGPHNVYAWDWTAWTGLNLH